MDFKQAIQHCLQNYGNFSGRASRSEFWYFALFTVLAILAAIVLNGMTGGNGALATLVSLGLIVPRLAVSVRRLHDIDKSGWWYLLIFVPLIGSLVLLFWYARKGTDGPNRFGGNPLIGSGAPVRT